MSFLSTRTAAAALAATLIAAPAALAEPYVMDKSHAHVTFTVDHLGFSTVHGQFRSFDAEIDFDPGQVEATSVVFTIEAASVDTFWEARDNHIRGKDFLDAENHPTIVFQSTSVTPTGADTATVIGNLTLRDVTQEITLEAKLNRLGPSPFNPQQTIAGFTATGEIDRTAFGVTYAAPAVGVTVPIRIDLEMSPAG